MVSPAKILIALAVIALVGAASYVASTMFLRDRITQAATEPSPAAPPVAPPSTEATNFQAIVERNGAVVLCVSNGEILFPDRCAGTGRLSIVQPIEEGELTLVSATGVVSIENRMPPNPDCAMSYAKWDPKTEQAKSTGRKIRKIPPEAVAQQLNKVYVGRANFMPEDVSAFGLDLDNDGREDIIYVTDNLSRLADLHEKTKQVYPYFLEGGIFRGQSPNFPSPFFHDEDEYRGATDAIGGVTLKGIVPLGATSSELAILAKTGSPLHGDQALVWLGAQRVQRLESFEFRCN